eukprot:TRINITY_DN3252_c0_g1_i2.p1 TRINITY_DN3252_c0_g1~~TRINITY_DN3252_c0_g1_i2.p1  ORF type:complete len:225 (-),score=-29.24 TRINITY_DN3252_c0_g1_i2:104-778(-)
MRFQVPQVTLSDFTYTTNFILNDSLLMFKHSSSYGYCIYRDQVANVHGLYIIDSTYYPLWELFLFLLQKHSNILTSIRSCMLLVLHRMTLIFEVLCTTAQKFCTNVISFYNSLKILISLFYNFMITRSYFVQFIFSHYIHPLYQIFRLFILCGRFNNIQRILVYSFGMHSGKIISQLKILYFNKCWCTIYMQLSVQIIKVFVLLIKYIIQISFCQVQFIFLNIF